MIRHLAETAYRSAVSLLEGMRVTLKYLMARPVTMEYPEQRWTLPERYRGVVTLVIDEKTGTHKCNACTLCVRACPNASLSQTKALGPDNKPYPAAFTLELGRCMFCGMCVEACPRGALAMNKEYELAVGRREDLTRSLLPAPAGSPGDKQP